MADAVCPAEQAEINLLRGFEVGFVHPAMSAYGEHPEDGAAAVVEHDDAQGRAVVPRELQEGVGVVQERQLAKQQPHGRVAAGADACRG